LGPGDGERVPLDGNALIVKFGLKGLVTEQLTATGNARLSSNISRQIAPLHGSPAAAKRTTAGHRSTAHP
jgi:hypothetical protein